MTETPRPSWTVNMYTASAVITCRKLPTVCFESSLLKFNPPPYFLSILGMENTFYISTPLPLPLFLLHPWQLRLLCVSLQAPLLNHPKEFSFSLSAQLVPRSSRAQNCSWCLPAQLSWARGLHQPAFTCRILVWDLPLKKTGCHFWPRRVWMRCEIYILSVELPNCSQACTCAVL